LILKKRTAHRFLLLGGHQPSAQVKRLGEDLKFPESIPHKPVGTYKNEIIESEAGLVV